MADSSEYEAWGAGQSAWSDDETGDKQDPRDTDHDEETEDMGYHDEDYEGGRLGAFSTGLVIGLAIGAGVALLLAPQPGATTRRLLSKRARRLGDGVSDRWGDLRDELDTLARRGRKRVRRGIKRSRWGATKGRWAAEDLVGKGRRSINR